MTDTLTDVTVGQLVAERPGRAGVFEKFGIDYCCGSNASLIDACREHEIDPESVLRNLDDAEHQDAPTGQDWTTAPLSDLADHIEQTHHAYLKQEMTYLDELACRIE